MPLYAPTNGSFDWVGFESLRSTRPFGGYDVRGSLAGKEQKDAIYADWWFSYQLTDNRARVHKVYIRLQPIVRGDESIAVTFGTTASGKTINPLVSVTSY